MINPIASQSPRSLARAAGLFWLLTILMSMFAFIIAGKFTVAGNAIVSLAIVAVPSLARLGLIHMMPMGLYEIGLGFWLLIRGIRLPAPQVP